jgi:hypothetical protein
MRVFVARSQLRMTDDEVVQVVTYFEDGAAIPDAMKRPELTMLTVPAAAVEQTQRFPVLARGWRQTYRESIVYGEAERRILDAFPDYSQRNSASELMGYIAVHGANAGAWPPPAQRRKTEIDRAWSYVETVRRASHGMLAGALPADPTANSHWPRPAAAYQSA